MDLRITGRYNKDNDVTETVSEKEPHQEKPMSVKDMLLNTDILLLISTVLWVNFVYTQGDLVVYIVAVRIFHWPINRLSIFPIATVVIALAVLKWIQRFNSGIDMYFLTVLSVICNAMSMAILTILSNYDIESSAMRTVLVLTTLSLNLIAGYSLVTFTSVLLSIVVPAHSACSIIGLRQVSVQTALTLGYFATSALFDIGKIVYPLMSMLCLVLAGVYLIRRTYFSQKYL